MKDKPRILILATGGTIAGTAELTTQTTDYKIAQVDVNDLLKAVPQAFDVADIVGEQFCQLNSGMITVEIWLSLAKRINEIFRNNEADGIVITHGTDTMEETAYFLNLTVKSKKPVVLTGSMRPGTALSADGPLNIYNAVLTACDKTSIGKGVLVAMDDYIIAARDVFKSNTCKTNTFTGGEMGLLGTVIGGVVEYYHQSTKRHTISSEFDIENRNSLPKVEIVYEYAGSGSMMFKTAVENGNEGIVMACVGNGDFNEAPSKFYKSLEEKPVVVRSSRIDEGKVTYSSDECDYNTVSSNNLNPQKSRILLMLALTITKDIDAIQEMFNTY